jgi:hypothetical protein
MIERGSVASKRVLCWDVSPLIAASISILCHNNGDEGMIECDNVVSKRELFFDVLRVFIEGRGIF